MSDISTILIDDRTGLVTWGFPVFGPVKLEGIFAIVQWAVYSILRLSGGDAFRPDYGTRFMLLPGTATINDMDALRADISLIIKAAENNMLEEQKKYNNIPASEKLKSMNIIRITQDETDPTIINIYLRVKNISEEIYDFGIPAIRA